MSKFKLFTSNIAFALNLLLLFLWMFEEQLVIPAAVQAVGRMHPLLLHLPIGFLLLTALLPFLRRSMSSEAFHELKVFSWGLVSVTTALTAIMGLLLAQESGYTTELVDQHKWAGIATSLLTYLMYLWVLYRRAAGTLYYAGVSLSVVVLIVAGHWGASITHGEDFIVAPLKADDRPELTEQTTVYDGLIQPLLQQKCMSCHNERKAKGELVMTTYRSLRKGGENGPALVPGDQDNSLLLKRLHLPMEDEEHMPPKGKPQLSEKEIELLEAWIAAGADPKVTIADIPKESPLGQIAALQLAQRKEQAETGRSYAFKPASSTTISRLNTPFRTLMPIAYGSPALSAEIFVRQAYEPNFLSELLEVKEQLVSLSLGHLPITDTELEIIGRFSNLEDLNLNFTDISGQSLDPLLSCRELRSLSLTGTAVDVDAVSELVQLPQLEEIYLWNTRLDSAELISLRASYPHIDFRDGYVDDPDEILALSPPIVKDRQSAEGVKQIELKHNFPGVVIRFTVDGSEPDSLTSPIYEGPIMPDSYAQIKARAFKENWQGSDIAEYTFFPPSVPVAKAELLTKPNPQYPGSGAAGLIDGQKGFAENFQSPLWLGYQDRDFIGLLYPEDPTVAVNLISLSYLQNIGAYIMPPTQVEVWGGPAADRLQKLATVPLQAPEKYMPNEVKGISVPIPLSRYACYKVHARPVRKLPAWHQGAGDKGWVFIDEVYLYGQTSTALVPADD